MTVADAFPGIRSGRPVWNLLVLIVYLLVLVFGFVFVPLIAAFAVGTNWHGWAERTARIPGISPDGGIKSGIVAFGYTFLVLALVSIVISPAGDASRQSVPADGTPPFTEEPNVADPSISPTVPSPVLPQSLPLTLTIVIVPARVRVH